MAKRRCSRCEIFLNPKNTCEHGGNGDMCDDCANEVLTGRMDFGAPIEIYGTPYKFPRPTDYEILHTVGKRGQSWTKWNK